MLGFSKKEIFNFALAGVALGLVLAFADILGAWTSTRPIFPHTPVVIHHQDGSDSGFDAEVARSESEQAYGLMFVKNLEAKAGMIFPYDPPRPVAFWMKNTLIPLDMLFVRPDGRIGRIVSQAQPLDVTPIPSQGPVEAVIELSGGSVRKENILIGDHVDSPALPPAQGLP